MSTNNNVEEGRIVLPQQLKMVLKGILLYITAIVAFVWVAGIDSIMDNGYFIEFTLVLAALIYACYKTMSEDEVDTLLGNKLLKKLGKCEEEENDEW